MIKKYLLPILLSSVFCSTTLQAQESSSVFSFLNLPTSARAVALGGQAASVISGDASLLLYNPALMMSVENRSLSLNFSTYLQGMKLGSAHYVQPAGDLGAWGVTAQFLNYGTISQADEEGSELGSTSPIDMMLGGGYSRVLGERWVAGALGKVLYSHYGSYSSLALAIDAGLNYYDEEHDLSMSVAARHIGVQLKAFDSERERLPFVAELALSKGLVGTPFTFHITLTDLNHWNSHYYSGTGEDISTGRLILNHFIFGLDVKIAKILCLSAGYNFRRAYELKAGDSAHGAGLSLGGSIEVKRLMLGVSWAKYHVSTSSLAFTAQYSF